MSYIYFIAKKYAFSKKRYRFLNFITIVSIAGIAIGVSALIIATSLINGFQKDIRDRLFKTSYHIMVIGPFSKGEIKTIKAKISALNEIESFTPVLYENVLVKYGESVSPAVIRGMPKESIKSEWLPYIQEKGKAIFCKNCVILGRLLSENIGVIEGENVKIFLPSLSLSPFGATPKRKKLKVSGILESGLYEFDSTTMLMPMDSLMKLLNKDKVSFIGIKIKKIFDAEKVKNKILSRLNFLYSVITWKELNSALFSALKLEKTVMFLTIALIVFVASLNIIATLILIVMDKLKDIGILSALGTTPSEIRKIFIFEGVLLGAIGTFFGTILGFIVIFVVNTFKLVKVPYKIYHITHIQMKPEFVDIALIITFSLILSLITTIYPSKRASEVDPAEVLREE